MNPPAWRPAGERALLLEVPENAAVTTANSVRRLAAAGDVAVVDVVPGAETVLVITASPEARARLITLVDRLNGEASEPGPEPTVVEIPVRYDGSDLAAVAEATGLSVTEVVRRHGEASYQAAFTGFAPGFAYLTGLDPALHLPRRSTFRPSVPAGSVAMADRYTAVYPTASPGGWHLLGTTTLEMFDRKRRPPARVAPGDVVRFTSERGTRL
ncbi:MAG TPA: 5-oxoprolinase subunit PxpB [Acidimicrobiales bacterium]|jgi:KipI family sensor histidine kinase inhibitor|nr:5-oxoprolinase subunit PxpB [Acidimicrobiales bacterium]